MSDRYVQVGVTRSRLVELAEIVSTTPRDIERMDVLVKEIAVEALGCYMHDHGKEVSE